MEKFIINWSYRLGFLFLILTVLARGLDVVAPTMNLIPTKGDHIGYLAFMHATFLLFGTTIATTCYAWFNSQESRVFTNGPELKKHQARPAELARN